MYSSPSHKNTLSPRQKLFFLIHLCQYQAHQAVFLSGKNTSEARHIDFALLDLVATPHSELCEKRGKVKNFRGTIIQRGCYNLILDQL